MKIIPILATLSTLGLMTANVSGTSDIQTQTPAYRSRTTRPAVPSFCIREDGTTVPGCENIRRFNLNFMGKDTKGISMVDCNVVAYVAGQRGCYKSDLSWSVLGDKSPNSSPLNLLSMDEYTLHGDRYLVNRRYYLNDGTIHDWGAATSQANNGYVFSLDKALHVSYAPEQNHVLSPIKGSSVGKSSYICNNGQWYFKEFDESKEMFAYPLVSKPSEEESFGYGEELVHLANQDDGVSFGSYYSPEMRCELHDDCDDLLGQGYSQDDIDAFKEFNVAYNNNFIIKN